MKKFNKFLSSALATILVFSSCMMSAFAAPSAHTYTVSADKTEGLKANDKITVEVKIDKTAGIFNAGYELQFDPEVFDVKTEMDFTTFVSAYIDAAWNTDMTNVQNLKWTRFLGMPTMNADAAAGKISCAWSGDTTIKMAIPDAQSSTDYVIGKFYLTVKEGAPQGDTQITVSGATFGYNENSADTMTYVPATLKVGEKAPATTDKAYYAEVTYGEKAKAATGIKFNLSTDDENAKSKTAEKDVPFKAVVEAIEKIAVALNIEGIPNGVTVTVDSAELY